MCELQNNIDVLREQLAKQEAILEQQKREVKEKKELSWGYNMGVLERIYEDKEMEAETRIGELEIRRQRKRYRKGSVHDKELDQGVSQQKKSYEQDAALFRLFKHLGDELWKIECKIQQNFTNLDDRLTHIEQILMDDIKKEEFLENIPCTAVASNDCVQWASDGKAIPPPWYDK